MDKQISTKCVSIRWIMQDPAFEHGVRDARAGQPFPVSFDTWQTNHRQVVVTLLAIKSGDLKRIPFTSSLALRRPARSLLGGRMDYIGHA